MESIIHPEVKKEISEELVKNLLTEHFIKTYDKDVVESALKGFSFICSERKNMNTVASAVVQNSSVPNLNYIYIQDP